MLKPRLLFAALLSLATLSEAVAGDRIDTVVTFKPGKTTYSHDGVIKGYQ